MSTSSRPRRAAALTALTVGGAVLLGAPAAVAQPGDNGDITIETTATTQAAQDSQPKVCQFVLRARNFDTVPAVTWTIAPQPTAPTPPPSNGTITLANGTGSSQNIELPARQYRLTWTVPGSTGPAQQKIFQLDCPNRVGPVTSPNGGPPAGGGGLAREDAFMPVAGTAAVGAAAVGGAVWFRLRHRRAHGAA
jgi:hypothetical protein